MTTQDGSDQDEQPATPSKSRTSIARQGQGRRLIRLCGKELREILRDRRTIITLVLMPLLVYPILTLTFNSFLLNSFQPESKIEPIIGFESEPEFLLFRDWYNAWSNELDVELSLEPESDEAQVRFVDGTDLRRRVSDGILDLGVVIEATETKGRNATGPARLNVELVYRKGSPTGEAAAEFMTKRLDALNHGFDKKLLGSGLPVRTNELIVKSESGAAFSFASFVPLMLILMTITGAVYPAIDLTAGERERGTMEALIAAPIPRIGLLLAKYVAVLMVAILTATANLFAMTITLLNSPLGNMLFGEAGFSWVVMAQIYSMMILFAALFSAILLAVTSFARSFKEAQAYLIPLMLVSLGPGILSLMPGMQLTPLIAVTPLLNLVLLSRDTIQGNADSLMATVAVISTGVYALAAITFAARIFGTDAILYGSEASWSDLLRKPRERQRCSTVAGAMFCLALLFPLQFVAASFVSKIGSRGPALSVPITIPESVSQAIIETNGQLVVDQMPPSTKLSEGNLIAEGTWTAAADEVQDIHLLSDRFIGQDFTLKLSVVAPSGEAVAGATADVTLTKAELTAGLDIGQTSLSYRLLLNALLTAGLFVGVPLISARWQRVDLLSGFRLTSAKWPAYVAGILLGVSLWPFAHEIVVFGLNVGIGSVEDKVQVVDRLVAQFRGLSPIVILFAMALTPAVCEEFFFRGFLLQAMLKTMRPNKAILVSAVLFGAFHLIGASVLAPERFLPSTFLGLVLGWVCVRTGSVLPGMVLHAFHNGFLLMTSYYRDELMEQGWFVSEGSHLPVTWLLSAVVAVIVGVAAIWFLGSKSATTAQKKHAPSS